jgi:hypothetical protein
VTEEMSFFLLDEVYDRKPDCLLYKKNQSTNQIGVSDKKEKETTNRTREEMKGKFVKAISKIETKVEDTSSTRNIIHDIAFLAAATAFRGDLLLLLLGFASEPGRK